MKAIVTVLMLTLCVLISLPGAERPFRVTLRVVDDEGQPVSGAQVGVTYENLKVVEGPKHFVSPRELSDERGRVTLNGDMSLNRLAYGATKDGYYQTTGLEYYFSVESGARWEPWNPTIELLLKRIENPGPMYVKRVSASLPARGTPVGYDLEAGDWVAPHGKGRTADLVFVGRLDQRGTEDWDWELKVSFSNPGDGLQRFEPGSSNGGSALRSPHEAPANGYLSSLTLARSRRPDIRDRTSFMPDGGYFLRVRTELDAQGHVIRAWYGKIYGDFFDMVYYLNPDGTRNVEFDPKRNLFKPRDDRDSAFWNLGP
jgi:hypothetical protein